MVLSDICAGHGLCLIEPYGDLVRTVLSAMPEERLKDVLYLYVTYYTSSFGLNLFEVEPGADATEVAKVASFVMHVFEKVWQVGPETPRLAQVLRNTTRVLIENPAMTFSEIPLLLWEDWVREKLVLLISEQTKLFWSQYNKKAPRDRDELIASTINKVDAYLNEPLIARIVSQSVSTINFRQIMDEGKILLVNLSPQLEEASRLIGAVLIGRLLMAAFSRTDTPADKRRPFLLYCDEYQRFSTSDFAVLLSEARKFRIGTVLATQTLEFLDDQNRATALQAGTLVVFRVSGDPDSKALAPSFDTTPTETVVVGQEPIRSPVTDPIGHLLRRGHLNPEVASFTHDYLACLGSLETHAARAHGAIEFGCCQLPVGFVDLGKRALNATLYECMATQNPAVAIAPLALFIAGGAWDEGITNVFYPHMRYTNYQFAGLEATANYLGHSRLLSDEKALARLRKKYAHRRHWDTVLTYHDVYPAHSFIRFLQALRGVMAILAAEPIMVDTGQYRDKYQLRSYQDQENLVANELSQLPNFHAKVKIVSSGEYTIKTKPPPALLTEQEVAARIRAIKERMLREGYTIPAAEIEESVRKRHEALRARPPGGPSQGNGKGRPKPPPDLA